MPDATDDFRPMSDQARELVRAIEDGGGWRRFAESMDALSSAFYRLGEQIGEALERIAASLSSVEDER